MIGLDAAAVPAGGDLAQQRRLVAIRPATRCCGTRTSGSTCSVAGSRSAVADGDLDQDVLGRRLRVLDEDIEVAVLVEDAGVEQLVLELAAAAGCGWCAPDRRRGRPPADTCRDTSCTSASASSRDRSSTPSRPRRDCLRCWSAQTAAPSESDRCRSTAPARSTAAACRRRCRRARPRPSGRRASAPGRG